MLYITMLLVYILFLHFVLSTINPLDPYYILGVPPIATVGEIKTAYTHLIKGKTSGKDQLNEIEKAYNILSDPEKRKSFDDLQETKWSNMKFLEIFHAIQKQDGNYLKQVPSKDLGEAIHYLWNYPVTLTKLLKWDEKNEYHWRIPKEDIGKVLDLTIQNDQRKLFGIILHYAWDRIPPADLNKSVKRLWNKPNWLKPMLANDSIDLFQGRIFQSSLLHLFELTAFHGNRASFSHLLQYSLDRVLSNSDLSKTIEYLWDKPDMLEQLLNWFHNYPWFGDIPMEAILKVKKKALTERNKKTLNLVFEYLQSIKDTKGSGVQQSSKPLKFLMHHKAVPHENGIWSILPNHIHLK